MNPILDNILKATRLRVEAAKQNQDSALLRSRAVTARSTAVSHALRSAIEPGETLKIIAEFKKASPSKGVINDLADPVETARSYEAAGACAISVLTEPHFFRGSLDDLRAIRSAVSVPILRKDFIVDEFQIYESAAAGADAILLIVAALGIDELIRFRSLAEVEMGMDALIEVHTVEEMKIAGEMGANLIGVNNRNLRTFEVSLDVSRRLAGIAPAGAMLVSESGLKTRDELVELRSLDYSAFLIGETLMRKADTVLKQEILL
ncbi:MAG: indole-3-glycerol phosphate synthase TrpC [Acidobacteriota bacterium]